MTNPSKWNEIDVDMFCEIFGMYWRRESHTTGRVLEIQNPWAIKEGHPECRVYFGASIKQEDFLEYNKDSIDFIKYVRSNVLSDFMQQVNLGICIVADSKPKITPVSNFKLNYDLIWYSFFYGKVEDKNSGNPFSNFILLPCVLWFLNPPGERRYVIGDYEEDGKIPGSKKYIRLRTWEYESWKNMMREYCKSGFSVEKLGCEDDIKAENIVYRNEGRKITEEPNFFTP